MAKNTEVLGVAAVILILTARNQSSGGYRDIGNLLNTIEVGSLLKDLHKMSVIINRMDNFGQMVLHPPEPPKLPPPSEMLANVLPDLSNLGSLGNLGGLGNIANLGNMSNLMENIAPVMAALGLGQNDQNKNDIF